MLSRPLAVLVGAALAGTVACGGAGGARDGATDGSDAGPPVETEFATGFELNEVVGCEGDRRSPTCGEDSTAHDFLLLLEPQPSEDWRTWDLDSSVMVPILYEEAAPAESRSAQIIDDPTGPSSPNRVLQFSVRDATIPVPFDGHRKGRVQTNLGFTPPISELYYRQRIYFHPDLGLLLDYPSDANQWWLSIIFQEMRAGSPGRGDEHSFSMILRLVPDFDAGVYRLVAMGQKKAGTMGGWETVWSTGDADTAVPLGEWLIVETAFRHGDADTGRFAAVLSREGEPTPLIALNVESWTYSPDSPTPVALTSSGGPQKLYSSDNVFHYIRDRGGVARILFDDFAGGTRWPSGWVPPVSTGIFVLEP